MHSEALGKDTHHILKHLSDSPTLGDPLRPIQADGTMSSGAQVHTLVGRDDLSPEESQKLRGKMAGYRNNWTELPSVPTGLRGSDSAEKEAQTLTSQASGRFLFVCYSFSLFPSLKKKKKRQTIIAHFENQELQ
jgi:hypothetical protein